MYALGWIAFGIGIGMLAAVPLVLRLLRQAEYRARLAERRARQTERLAELGSMTGGLAHEIKNPLSTIGLNAQLLSEAVADSDLPAEQRDRLLRRIGALSREVERLTGILTDFLQFAGRIKLDPQPHDLGEILNELSDFFHPQCDQAGVMLRTQVPPNPLVAEVDEGLLKQALLNLMINAVQAMAEPKPSSRQSEPEGRRGELMLRLDPDGGEARIQVIDTGPGIEPEKLDQIFHPYVSLRSGGTGLGLATARRIVEEHRGRLEAHSEMGRGSEFSIWLPLQETGERVSGQGDKVTRWQGAKRAV